jgi:hypothetical protein
MRRPDTRTNTPSTGLRESDLGSINYLAPMCGGTPSRQRTGERPPSRLRVRSIRSWTSGHEVGSGLSPR